MSRPTIFVLGISILKNDFKGEFAQLNVSRSLKPLNIDKSDFKMTRRTVGESGEVSKYDTPLFVDLNYALEIERVGALVPRRLYEVELGLDMDNPLDGSVITKLIPVDEDVKAHFKTCGLIK
ncbi:DUF1293 family protein [Vibrio aestuarianus]|uniref:Uncharacterized protein n=1 Tax=Vibrio aestuarianus TaxID=28171 RepID=A0ABN8TPE2_9VIBR|nr:DUF1293 family protein [Vibrio aestuarianus]MDE1229311.1 DUF1293 family protein [Vibrio aestuarianus]MDE1258818.1 DUF1293 family protein [Vibrio aestuarianus]MDE1272164.1 DUF1293 family protein [Vibrio aestuarianus]MDE1293557.1 DUF1293 family protein [Vibrio aestuarianus]MDE1307726.1 DUF1293 family protein [Vibrio aestuarianus]